MQMLSRNGPQFRTKLLDRSAAERFCRCLQANNAFAGAIVTESNRATHPVRRWMVVYHAANGQRRQELLDAHQQGRRDRAAAQEPGYSALVVEQGAGYACRLRNLTHGRWYVVTLDGCLQPCDCDCPDHEGTARAANIECKHHEIVRIKLESGRFDTALAPAGNPEDDPFGPEPDEPGRAVTDAEWEEALAEQERQAEAETEAQAAWVAERETRFAHDWPEA